MAPRLLSGELILKAIASSFVLEFFCGYIASGITLYLSGTRVSCIYSLWIYRVSKNTTVTFLFDSSIKMPLKSTLAHSNTLRLPGVPPLLLNLLCFLSLFLSLSLSNSLPLCLSPSLSPFLFFLSLFRSYYCHTHRYFSSSHVTSVSGQACHLPDSIATATQQKAVEPCREESLQFVDLHVTERAVSKS